MILDATGWDATFKIALADGTACLSRRPVVVWQELDGDVRGLVLDAKTGLRAAPNYGNFAGYERDEHLVVAIVPAAGARAVYKGDDGTEHRWKVPLYALMADGQIKAVEPDDKGDFEEVTAASNFLRLELDGDEPAAS